MTCEEALVLVEALLPQVGISDLQELVFCQSWQGKSYLEIAENTGYEADYIKNVGSQLWQSLSQALGKQITKKNFQSVFRQEARKTSAVAKVVAAPVGTNEIVSNAQAPDTGIPQKALSLSSPEANNIQKRQDWGEAVDASIFYGRSDELATLRKWIVQERCRLVSILGMGGVGKTALSVKLAEQVQGEFEYLFWRSLRDAPPLNDLLTTLLRFLKEDSPLPDTESGKLSQLLECLRSTRCLVVLDNFEALFTPGQERGAYRQRYKGYGELLHRVGESCHQSCFVITSRETPLEITVLQGEYLPVREWRLLGLKAVAAYKLLEVKGVDSSLDELDDLVKCYQGNPLALKIAASSIQSLFAGNIADFLQQGVVVFNGIRHLLKTQVERLSEREQQVMYWLAINREPVSVSELQSDIVPTLFNSALLEALESLKGRSLIERTAEGFTLQPVIMEYMTEQLIAQVKAELTQPSQNTFACFLSRYTLLKATAKDYVRSSQIRVILETLVSQAMTRLGSKQALIKKLNQRLWQLRIHNSDPGGYTVGNLLNLFNYLQVDLRGFDFSHFSVWQADLTQVKLQQVNFAYADLSRSTFAETFGGISCVAFSPDGKLLATSDTSGQVQIWEMESKKQLNAFKADLVWTWAVAFSPDGKLLASAGDDYTVKFWHVQTGECLQLLKGHTSTVNALAFHPHGHLLASCAQDATIRIWQVSNLEQDLLVVLLGHQERVWSVAFSPDGSTLVSGSEDRTLKLWDVKTGECRQTLSGHSHWVKSVTFSPDGQSIVSGSFDGLLKLWSASTMECIQTWQGHKMTVTAVTFSPDGCWLASASYDQTVKVWDVASQQCIRTLSEHSNRVWSVAFSPDAQYLASGGDDHAARLWHLKTGQCAKAWKGHTNSILSLALSQEQLLATGHEDQTVKLWNLQTGQISQVLYGHENRVWSVAFAPHQTGQNLDETILASGSADRTIKLWHVQTGQCLKTLYGHRSWVWSVAFSPDSHQLASCSYDHTIKLWDVESGECLTTLNEHTAPVISVTFSPDGRWLASSSFDTTIRFWDIQAGKCLQTLQGHQNSVWAIAFNRDGKYLASGSYDHTVKLWDVQTGKCLRTFEGHSASVVSLAFSSNGGQLVSGSFERTLKVWDLNTGNCLRTLHGHTDLVSALVFQAIGSAIDSNSLEQCEILISGSFDETIRFWDSKTGKCLKTLHTPRPYDGMNITGVTGLTDAQKATLRALGAIEKS